MLLVHMLSSSLFLCAALRCAIVARPQRRRRRQNEFSYFLIAEKKQRNTEKRKCFFICARNAARQRDAATSFNTLHSLLLSLEALGKEKGFEQRGGGVVWSQLHTMPESNVVASFWSAKSFLSVARRISFSGVHNKNACKNANVASGSWSAAGGEGAKSLKTWSTGRGALGGFLFWLNATRNYDTFNYQASDWRAARDLQPASTCSSVQHTHSNTPAKPCHISARSLTAVSFWQHLAARRGSRHSRRAARRVLQFAPF